MTDELEQLRVIVTGGASGIGAATTELFSRRGARVAVLDRDPDVHESPIGRTADVTDDDAVRGAVEGAARQLGGIDVLVNNAGIGAQGGVADNDEAEWHRVLDTNVVGMVRVLRAALPHLRASAQPAVVNTCSIAATTGLPNRVLYSASKGAVLSMSRALAADLIEEGIRVNCVNPGTVDTPWVRRLLEASSDPAKEREALQRRQPMKRLVSAEEVASAIAYLSSPLNAAVTGTELAVDGGMRDLRLRD